MKLILNICLILFTVLLNAQSQDHNYVLNTTFLGENGTNPVKKIIYFDEMGREVQQIIHKQADNNNDIVTIKNYDGFGRSNKEYLPYVTNNQSLNFRANAFNELLSYYANIIETEHDSNPYTEIEFEQSTLNRKTKIAHPGEDWKMGNGHEIKYEYEFNSLSDSILNIKVVTTYNSANKIYISSLQNNGIYAENEIYKNIIKNENWVINDNKNNTTEEYINKLGQKILIRTYNNNIKHDTYYLYDIYGNLAFVIPPIVNKNININQQNLDKYCYQYRYDNKNRLIEKKLPGVGWESLVYDKLDRVVLTQNAIQKGKEWNFQKYDEYNRIVYSGIFSNTSTRYSMQNAINSMSANAANIEKRSNTSFLNNGINVYYTKNAFPTGSMLITQIYYYDSYENTGADKFSSQNNYIFLNGSDPKLKGLIVAAYKNILGTTTWNKTYNYYEDKYLRNVRNEEINVNGRIYTNHIIDFSGKVLNTSVVHHYNQNQNPIIINDEFEYTPQNRLKKQISKIGNQEKQLIFNLDYDFLGKVKVKKIGGTDISANNSLQEVDYKYNIRGWLTDINDVNNSNNNEDLFNYKIDYTRRNFISQVKANYNGNISSVYWRTLSDNVLKTYVYKYDHLSRLILATDYASRKPTKKFMEELTYDKNGNIITLNRTGALIDQQINKIDELTYTYADNKLIKIQDATGNPDGFKDGSNTDNDYEYDLVGNIIKDNNKKITEIKYNHLNLPIEITLDIGKIFYTYDASGLKVKKVVQPTDGPIMTTEYINGFQYLNGQLQFFPQAEGYVKPNDDGSYLYVYQYKDHLGNIRLSYADCNGDENIDLATEILEENNYYPFGLKHQGYNEIANSYRNEAAEKYKYNGKEFQDELDLNWYDYHARNYDPAIGRWLNVDPLAEEFPEWSPYSYGFNNPLRFTDPTGMAPEDIIIRGKNNSSITIVTDLVDISVNAGSVVGDLGGNYTLQGDGVLIAALDIVGIVDPTGVADIAAASLEAKNGNWGSALLSGMGAIPYVGDIGKVGKVGKHLKTIENAIDGAKAVNGNSKASTKAQHVYEIFETGTGNVVKPGISGGKVSKADKSYRATSQVNKMNKAEGAGKYDSRIVEKIPAGPGARQKALDAEKANANKNRSTLNPNYHKRP